MSEYLLKKHLAAWNRKPVLRAVYTNWYNKIHENLKPGRTLEIGGGTGNLKTYLPELITSDVIHLPWLNLVLDAHTLPFQSNCMQNIVLFDVLHHLDNPVFFFDEAIRILHTGGRIILMEPYISPISYMVYRFFHKEPVDLSQNPFRTTTPTPDREPFDANQAIPSLIFGRYRKRFQTKYPEFKFRCDERLSFFAYPLSGGFDKPALIPIRAVKPILSLEKTLRLLSPLLSFRMFIVLEKESK
jgi:SAM-dependent methyltransferase